MCKCYSSVLLHNKNVIPVYTIHDKIEEYDGGDIVCGEYFVVDVELKVQTYNGEKFMLDDCFRSYLTVRHWLEKGIICKDQIKFMYKSSSGLDSKAMSDFVKFVYKKFDFGIAKDLVNKLIGGFGSKYKSKKEGFMTTSLEDVIATWYEETERQVRINERHGLFLVKSYLQSLKLGNNTSLLRFVVDGGVRAVVNAMFEIGGKIVAVSTDCVMAYSNYSCVKKSDRKNVIGEVGNLFEEGFKRLPYNRNVRNAKLEIKYLYTGKGCMYTGMPGCGKSTKLIEIANEKLKEGKKSSNLEFY